MKITYEIPDEWVEHLAAEYGYREKIVEPKIITRDGVKQVEHEEIDNPKTKLQFVEDVIKERLTSQVKNRLAQLKQNEIQKELDLQVSSDSIKKVK